MLRKIKLVFLREYLSRVKKKSFIVMTILGPLFFAASFITPALLSNVEDSEVRKIAVIDSSKLFLNLIPNTKHLEFENIEGVSVSELKQKFTSLGYYAILYIPHSVVFSSNTVQFISFNEPSILTTTHIKTHIDKYLQEFKLKTHQIENIDELIRSVKSDVSIRIVKLQLGNKSQESSIEDRKFKMIAGYISGFLIYFFIFLFGSQVMRGVMEEKSSRVVEIIISSVKPFHLMMGKILGIGAVGLTQFILWILLTGGIITIANNVLLKKESFAINQNPIAADVMGATNISNSQPAVKQLNADPAKTFIMALDNINFKLIIVSFVVFFIGGYILYASLFAAIGSAVDSDTDTQQFMMPVTIPLLLSVFVMINTINNPEGDISFWFSLIPFTSPIIMMVRLPFGVPIWQFSLSIALLFITFFFTTWVSAKIYRTGILMYGKKVTYKEIWKWLRYKNH